MLLLAVSIAFTASTTVIYKPLNQTHYQNIDKAENIVSLGIVNRKGLFSALNKNQFDSIIENSPFFNGLFNVTPVSANIEFQGNKEKLQGELVDSEFFNGLNLDIETGRAFSVAEYQRANKVPRVMVSAALAKSYFGSVADALGQFIKIDDQSYDVIGVVDKRFNGLSKNNVSFWLPSSHYHLIFGEKFSSSIQWNVVLPFTYSAAVTVDHWTTHDFRKFNHRLTQIVRSTKHIGQQDKVIVFDGLSLDPLNSEKQRKQMLILMVAAISILVVVLLNIGRYWNADLISRKNEITTRCALGASKANLLTLLQLETGLFLLLAFAVSFVIYPFLHRLISTTVGEHLVHVDLSGGLITLLAVNAAAITLCAVVLSTLNWLMLRRFWLALTAEVNAGVWQYICKNGLLIMQLAFSICALYYVAQMSFVYNELAKTDLGYKTENVSVMHMEQTNQTVDYPVNALMFNTKNELMTQPQILDVAFASFVPLYTELSTSPFSPVNNSEKTKMFSIAAVSANFFDTLDIKFLSGRTFAASEQDVVIVNQAYADEYLTPDTAVSRVFRELSLNSHKPDGTTIRRVVMKPMTIVGIVNDTAFVSLRTPVEPIIYMPLNDTSEMNGIIIASNGPVKPSGMAMLNELVEQHLPSGSEIQESLNLKQLENVDFRQSFKTMPVFFLAAVFAIILTFSGTQSSALQFITLRQRAIAILIAVGASKSDINIYVIRYLGSTLLASLLLSFILVGGLSSSLLESSNLIRGVDLSALCIAVAIVLVIFVLSLIYPLKLLRSVQPWAILKKE